jgi:hypothetical protein
VPECIPAILFFMPARTAARRMIFDSTPSGLSGRLRFLLTVQQIYRGWNLLGIVVAAVLISALALAITLRREQRAFVFALIGLLCLVGTQVVFWTYTYPTNQITNNWTMLPDSWMQLRRQWEYSHATSAILNLLALCLLIASVLVRRER